MLISCHHIKHLHYLIYFKDITNKQTLTLTHARAHVLARIYVSEIVNIIYLYTVDVFRDKFLSYEEN